MIRAQASRSIGYRFETKGSARFDEGAAERLLARAKAEGLVTEYDTGRGAVVWFNGRPGAALRALRDQVKAIVESAK